MEMPRQRMVKPEFFDSESLGACSMAARLLFIGLWVMGDDYGNVKMQPSRLKMNIFPYDAITDSEFLGLLRELEQTGCIKGYEVDGERYVNVPNFSVYQTVNRPSKSSVPEPPKSTAKAKRTRVVEEWSKGHGALTESNVDNSVNIDAFNEPSMSTHPERKKEGKKEVVVLQQQLPKESAECVAAAVETAPHSAPKCLMCGTDLECTGMADPEYWWCQGCKDFYPQWKVAS